MADKSKINKNNKRIEISERYAPLIAQLKKDGNYEALQKLPRDASKSRVRNRCSIDGRPHGYIRKFGISRIHFRELALKGELPGVKKASW